MFLLSASSCCALMKAEWYCQLTLLLCILCATDGLTQVPQGSELERTVSIPVMVSKKDGSPATGLSTLGFSLLEADRNRPIDTVSEVLPLLAGKSKTKVAFVLFDAMTSPLKFQT